jgi:hypothetical protein
MSKNKVKNKKRKTISRKRHASLSAVRYSHPLVIIALVLITLLAAAHIQITQNLATSPQNVLGEGEQSEAQKQAEESAKETAKQAQEVQKESTKQTEEQQKQQQEQQREAGKTTTANTSETAGSSEGFTKTRTETVSSSGLKIKTESEGNKQESEIETADGQKIKTKVEDDGTTKIEIENGTVKLTYRVENGQVVLSAENEEGKAVEIKEDKLAELDNSVADELGDDDIKLVPTSDNQLAVTQNQVAAVTDFPLSINVETKELIVTTPDGQKIVTVLPDQAVQNLLATGIINKVEAPLADASTQDQFGSSTDVVELEMRDNEVVYKIHGVKTHRILGFIPVDTQATAFVSADSGAVVAQQRSILANVVDFLSP